MDKDKLKGAVASELIIVAMETKGKRPTQLNFEEMTDVVADVVNKISAYPMLADSLPLSKNCEYFNSFTMRTLKDLTQEECIKIASIAKPDVEWKFVQSADKWDGFDLVEKDCENENIAKYIFQIDYRSSEELKSKPRFRIYEDLHEYSVNIEAIINYLMSIGCAAS